MKRVKFLKFPPSGGVIKGISSSSQAGGYICEGDMANPNDGGGKITSIQFDGAFLYFRKTDKDGKPVRNFGPVSMRGEGVTRSLEADGAAVSADGYVILFDDETVLEVPAKQPEDPPPAKPIQQGQRR